MRSSLILLVVAVAAFGACGGDDGGATDASAMDAGAGDARDGGTGAPCNGKCPATCRGVCSGLCDDLDDHGFCRGRCEGICVGGCSGMCQAVMRPAPGAGLPLDGGVLLDAKGADAKPLDAAVTDAPVTDAATDAAPSDAALVDALAADGAPSAGWVDRTRPRDLSWPPLSQAGAIAYDVRRKVVVMFGGWSTKSNATWEWSGDTGSWRLRMEAGPRPSRRTGAALVYDRTSGKVLLHGGVDESNSSVNDTWEWDGEKGTWTPKSAAGPTPARWGHAMVYDEDRKRVVLFGGSYRHAMLGDGDLFDTWDYDPEKDAWTNRTYPLPPSWPRPRRGHAMAYLPTRKAVVVHGGEIAGVATAAADLWEWDGAQRTWREIPSALDNGPGPRAFHGLVHERLGRLLLFGAGYPNLWAWDGPELGWSRLSPGSRPASWPPARLPSLAAWDEARRVLFVAGAAVTFARDTLTDVWEFSP